GPRTTDVVLEAGAGQRGPLLVSIREELDLPLPPPVPLKRRDGEERAQVHAAPLHGVEYDVVVAFAGVAIGTPPLSVEVAHVFAELVAGGAVDLVEEAFHRVGVLALDDDASPGPERHGDERVES